MRKRGSSRWPVSVCLSVCLSVRLSITLVYCIETAKDIIRLSSRPGSPTIPVFEPKHGYIIPGETFSAAVLNKRVLRKKQ